MAICMALECLRIRTRAASRRAARGADRPRHRDRCRRRPLTRESATCAWMPTALRSPTRRSPPAVTVRDDVGIEAIAAADWNALAGGTPLLSHAFLSRAARDRLRVARHRLDARAISPPGATARSPARCRSTPRRTPTASTSSTGRGPTPTAATAGATIRSSSRRFRSRRRRARGCSPPTTPCAPRCSRAALARLQPRATATAIRRSRRCTCCFRPRPRPRACEAAGMIVRNGVQFRWENPGYRDFADFLATFNHDKRKKVKQERRQGRRGRHHVHAQGRRARSRRADWAFFYRCYEHTYREHHSTPYLTLEFFERIGAELPGNLMLAIGRRDGTPICAALDVFDADTLWGRYWGTTEYVPGLHFEACYYQAIEFCIERRIARFEGGAQGVHKLARGLVAGDHVVGARDRRSRVRARDRRVLRARARRRRARHRRARRGEPVSPRRNAGCKSPRAAPARLAAIACQTRSDERHRTAHPRRSRRDADAQSPGRAQCARSRDDRRARRAHGGGRRRRQPARRRAARRRAAFHGRRRHPLVRRSGSARRRPRAAKASRA